MAKSKLLLHVCCAPCSTHVVAELMNEYDVALYFYNPNVYPKKEYEKRLSEIKKYASETGLKLIEGEYDYNEWLNTIKGLENEKEGGNRCVVCFKLRLLETAKFAKENELDIFACTLTVSPYKNKNIVNEIGKESAKKYSVEYLESDFKKKDGYKKSIELSKKHGLYRQEYCGCAFSIKDG